MPDSPDSTDPEAWRPDHPIPPWLENQCRRGIADRLAAIEQLQRDLLVEIYPGRLAAIGAKIDENRNAIAAHKNTLGAYGIDPDATLPDDSPRPFKTGTKSDLNSWLGYHQRSPGLLEKLHERGAIRLDHVSGGRKSVWRVTIIDPSKLEKPIRE